MIGAVIPVVGLVGGILYLKYIASQNVNDELQKRKLPYCWMKASEMLKSVTANGDTIEWGQGAHTEVQMRTFSSDKTKKSFYALYGYLVNSRQNVVAIWDIDEENIARYDSNPSTDVLIDPFHNFKPFENNMKDMMLLARLLCKGKGKKININMPGNDAHLTPSDDIVNRSLGREDDDGEE